MSNEQEKEIHEIYFDNIENLNKLVDAFKILKENFIPFNIDDINENNYKEIRRKIIGFNEFFPNVKALLALIENFKIQSISDEALEGMKKSLKQINDSKCFVENPIKNK